MGKDQHISSAAMCTSDNNRAPLRAIPAQPTPVSQTAPTMEGAAVPGGQWPSPTKDTPSKTVVPVESFELEDNTTSSGGTSWTLRVPWLRNKRPRRLRQDDENSSIQTVQSRATTKPVLPGCEDQEATYYGGLMNNGSPTFVSVEAGNIETLEGDGLYRDSSPAPARVLQQQRQPQRHKKSPAKQKRRHSRKMSHKASKRGAPEMDQNLLPEHNPPPPTAATATDTDIAATESGTRRQFFLGDTPRREPKNNNKVFRNRSWISTSSKESEGGKRNRRQGSTEDDSLADFDEAEWTPQDSAYGAAIPVCGWVPKRLRQGIEATLIAFTVFALVYLVVTTSISISESKANGSHVSYNDTYANSGVKTYDNGLDDDWYVEYSQYQNDEDDYFNNDNKNNGGGEDNDNDGNHRG